ncbi:hypothetical protein JVT61DRAFT_12213 [Boletus reticuloceps]|uniref:Uncharacterized protein n=1 Tax=Boletus reticuloceps TaxID=495285 RepID=A0A8I3A516_9AGAM|nr:hypothetical protein JVT61DRAFT_12213 [Boletus reticuloceps]
MIGLRVEWCKAHARADRWQEEATLLKEEMQRIKMFLAWEKNQWLERASVRMFETDADCKGSAAYAKQQAALRGGGILEATTALWDTIPSLLLTESSGRTEQSSLT